jgi:hypothetical protein
MEVFANVAILICGFIQMKRLVSVKGDKPFLLDVLLVLREMFNPFGVAGAVGMVFGYIGVTPPGSVYCLTSLF